MGVENGCVRARAGASFRRPGAVLTGLAVFISATYRASSYVVPPSMKTMISVGALRFTEGCAHRRVHQFLPPKPCTRRPAHIGSNRAKVPLAPLWTWALPVFFLK